MPRSLVRFTSGVSTKDDLVPACFLYNHFDEMLLPGEIIRQIIDKRLPWSYVALNLEVDSFAFNSIYRQKG